MILDIILQSDLYVNRENNDLQNLINMIIYNVDKRVYTGREKWIL